MIDAEKLRIKLEYYARLGGGTLYQALEEVAGCLIEPACEHGDDNFLAMRFCSKCGTNKPVSQPEECKCPIEDMNVICDVCSQPDQPNGFPSHYQHLKSPCCNATWQGCDHMHIGGNCPRKCSECGELEPMGYLKVGKSYWPIWRKDRVQDNKSLKE